MDLLTIDFTGFEKVREQLSQIKRYHMYSPMYYRSNDNTHSENVFYLLKKSMPHIKTIYPNFNEKRALLMALVHDDAEIIIGDIQAGNKAKMNAQELQELKEKERKAIQDMAKQLPLTLQGENYASLLIEAQEEKTKEAQVIKYLDKFDAYGEACHEIFAGNSIFNEHLTNSFGQIEKPIEFYIKRFNAYEKKYYLLHELIKSNTTPFLEKYEYFNKETIQGRLHTKENITEKTISSPYNYWKKAIAETKEGMKRLIEKIE